jgi:hypothetical protein
MATQIETTITVQNTELLDNSTNNNNNNNNNNTTPNTYDLQTCPGNVYLQYAVLPSLYPALQTLDSIRPSDPVEFLAVMMLQNSSRLRKGEEEAVEILQLQEDVWKQISEQYSTSDRL